MIDKVRRDILAMGAAATAVAAAPRVFAQQTGPGGATTSFYEKGNVRIRYSEVGSGFPVLVTPGGGLNAGENPGVERVDARQTDVRCAASP